MNQSAMAVPGSHEARAGQPGKLSPWWRKLLLTVHIVAAVGLIGADLSVITLGITGLVSSAPELIRAGYLMMDLLVQNVLLPFALIALLTGVVLALGTSWGLARYYWVLTKLGLTVAALTALVFVLRPRINQAAAEVLQVPLAELAATGIGPAGIAVTAGPMGAVLVLLTATILGVYKPWGQIRLRGRVQPATAQSLNLDQQGQ